MEVGVRVCVCMCVVTVIFFFLRKPFLEKLWGKKEKTFEGKLC